MVLCTMPDPSKLPDIPQGDGEDAKDYRVLTLKVKSSERQVEFVEEEFTIYDCNSRTS